MRRNNWSVAIFEYKKRSCDNISGFMLGLEMNIFIVLFICIHPK